MNPSHSPPWPPPTDILTAVRRVEKTLVAVTKDIADLSDDMEAINARLIELPSLSPPQRRTIPLPGVPVTGYNNPNLPKGI